jgi:hypothetical protein
VSPEEPSPLAHRALLVRGLAIPAGAVCARLVVDLNIRTINGGSTPNTDL